jgi:predicted RNA-binding protein with PIN domain
MPSDRHVLIDAYNVIHAWPHLRAALKDHGPDAARAQLADAVRPIHDIAGWRVSLVFDGRGDALVIERPGTELTFSYVYGPRGLTADAVIEQIVLNATLPSLDAPGGKAASARPAAAKASRKFSPKNIRRHSQDPAASQRPRLDPDKEIIVVTRDNLLSEATAASGAHNLSPTGLLDWVRNLAAQQTRDLTTRHQKSRSAWKSAPSPWDKLSK